MAKVIHVDLFGKRTEKYDFLGADRSRLHPSVSLSPSSPFFLFTCSDQHAGIEFEAFRSITDVLPLCSLGLLTKRDDLLVGFGPEDVWNKVDHFLDSRVSDVVIAKEFGLPLRDKDRWDLSKARKQARAEHKRQVIAGLTYRPFDNRSIYYTNTLVARTNRRVLSNLNKVNSGLVLGRQGAAVGTPVWDVVFCTNELIDQNAFRRGGSTVFPLHIYPTREEAAMGVEKKPNFNPQFLDEVVGAIARSFNKSTLIPENAMPFIDGGPLVEPAQPTLESFGDALGADQGSLESAPKSVVETSAPSFSPEDVFQYIYAVLHSPSYRSRYAEFLKIDFPRIPLPGGPEVFDALVPLGGELVALHLMESPRLNEPMTTFIGQGAPQVEKVSYTNQTVWINKDQTKGFQGVPESVWNFYIGGYQVCEKWLKDRGPKKGKPGRTLTPEDIDHYHRIVVALSETIRIMAEIDNAIEAHGGWPGAFQGAGQ